MLTGYHEDLPIKPGMKVKIPKGTAIRTTGPHPKAPARRSLTVTVNHTLPGQTITVGHYYVASETWYWTEREKDLYWVMRQMGLPHSTKAEREAALETIKAEAMKNLEDTWGHGKVMSARLHTQNPSVRWVGSGGYWMEADINLVKVV